MIALSMDMHLRTAMVLDRMTMYFNNLVTSFLKDKDLKVLKPLSGWREEQKNNQGNKTN